MLPETVTVATAPVPVPPVNDTFVYGEPPSTQSVGFTVIEPNNSSAVVTNLPGEADVVTSTVKPDPPAGDTVVTSPV